MRTALCVMVLMGVPAAARAQTQPPSDNPAHTCVKGIGQFCPGESESDTGTGIIGNWIQLFRGNRGNAESEREKGENKAFERAFNDIRKAGDRAEDRRRDEEKARIGRARQSITLRPAFNGLTVTPNSAAAFGPAPAAPVPGPAAPITAPAGVIAAAPRGVVPPAWNEVYCASFIAGAAFESLRLDTADATWNPSTRQFDARIGEALNAFDGTRQVRCGQPVAPPSGFSQGQADTYRFKYRAFLERARRAAASLDEALAQRRRSLDGLIAAQKQVNELQPDLAAAMELARLRAIRDALDAPPGTKTVPPPLPPGSANRPAFLPPPPADEAKRRALREALAAQAVARQLYANDDSAVSARKDELEKANDLANGLKNGQNEALSLLLQADAQR